jgi:XTP/dITP diphosphohydrolase
VNEIWVATGNKGKLAEFKLLFEKELPGYKTHSINELPTFHAPPENGETFLDNARIKAKSLKAVKPGVWIVADDSGLEVEGLNNLPGVHSARYAGPKAQDSENVAKLLKMIQIRSATHRNAQFVCCLVVFTPNGEEWVFDGKLKGQIAKTPSGLHGFGYDPVFIPEGETQSLAELGFAYKNKHSHRAKACLEFIKKIKAL